MSALRPGTKASTFDLPLVGGGRIELQTALRESAVLLAFFKVSCPICQYAFPFYDRLAHAVNSKSLKVVAVSQNDEDETQKFAQEFGVTFPIALDDTRSYHVSNAYGLTTVPTLFEISQDGQITTSCEGWEKAVIEDIYGRYAISETPVKPMFSPGEQVADFRAG